MPILKFAIKFGALMLVFYALAETPYCQRVFWPANLQANAWVANGVLRGFQQHTSVAGATSRPSNMSLSSNAVVTQPNRFVCWWRR